MDFVIGHPRSGTKLVAALLNLAGDRIASHERLVTRVVDDWSTRTDFIDRASDYYHGHCGAEELRGYFELYRQPPVFRVDANWKLTWILPVVLAEYPGARFVHIVRDPRETVRACYNLDYYGHQFAASAYFADRPTLQAWYRAMPNIKRPDWSTLDKFERNCAFWSESQRLAMEALENRSGRYLRIRVEDLESQAVQASLFDFLGITPPSQPALAQVLRASANPKTVEKTEIERQGIERLPDPVHWPERQHTSFARICGPYAEMFGYSKGTP